MHQQIYNEFIEIPMRPRTMFYYVPRTGILRAVRQSTEAFHGTVLDVGCGYMPYREIVESNPKVTKYIGMDMADSELYGRVEPDLIWNGVAIPLDDCSIECIMATEFLEHHSDPAAVLSEFYRVLSPGGTLLATVPFIWNLHEIPHDEYRYTPFSLSRVTGDAGFHDIAVRGLGGWNASMAQMIGLWITFAIMPSVIRSILRLILFPVFAILVKADRRPDTFDDTQNSMFTGLCLTARK